MENLKRNSSFAMFVAVVVFLIARRVGAQEQALSTVPPPSSPPYPFFDLFTGASNYYSEPMRKTSYDPYHISCPKSDTLGSFANILGSAAKIMFSVAIILFLKMLAGKLMLLPLTILLFAKIGLKALFFWPMISKMIKFLKKKKKRHHKARTIVDCSERVACIIQRSSEIGWKSNLGAAATFTLIDDVEEDSTFAETLLTILAGDKVARCMSLECTSGVDIS